MPKGDKLHDGLERLFDELRPSIERIPLIDSDGNVVDSFYIGDGNAELLVECLNGYRMAAADITPLGDPYYREWQLFRRGPDDYLLARWHGGDYCGRAISASEAATHCHRSGTRPPDIVLDDLAADSATNEKPRAKRVCFTRIFIGGRVAFARLTGEEYTPPTEAIEPSVHQASEVSADDAPWCFYLGGGKLLVDGVGVNIEDAEIAALEALIELRTCKLPDLVAKSGHPKAARLLKRITTKHPALKRHIKLPGKRGNGGYSTTIVNG